MSCFTSTFSDELSSCSLSCSASPLGKQEFPVHVETTSTTISLPPSLPPSLSPSGDALCYMYSSYGVTLWYPSYVKQINDQKDDNKFDKFCDRNVTSSDVSLSLLDSLCDCTQTTFHGSVIGDVLVEDWIISARFIGTSFGRTHFSNVLFKDCEFVDCAMDGVALHSAHFVNSRLTGLSLSDATIQESQFCGVHGEKISIRNVTIEDVLVNGREAENSTVFVSLLNTSEGCSNGKVEKIEESVDVDCREIDDDDRVYRDNFIIAASALPGNIVSAIAVYFFRRNYWLGRVEHLIVM